MWFLFSYLVFPHLAPDDYTSLTISVNFVVSSRTAIAYVSTKRDSIVEGDEDMFVTILPPPSSSPIRVCEDNIARVIIKDRG